MISFWGLEMHCTHACNLNCQSCSHYSNHHHGGHVAVEEADEEMQFWCNRIKPKRFGILGGEPALHPKLGQWLIMTRKNWKYSEIGLTTNGILLPKLHPNLGEILKETNINLSISQHSNDPEYLELFNSALVVMKGWSSKYKIPIRVRDYTKLWRNQYFGYGDNMMPYEDKDPKKSWENCRARECHTLFEKKLWKCPPLTWLHLQKNKFNLNPIWDQYLEYKYKGALNHTATDEEIKNWLNIKEESYCSMCPKNPKLLDLPNPLKQPTLIQLGLPKKENNKTPDNKEITKEFTVIKKIFS